MKFSLRLFLSLIACAGLSLSVAWAAGNVSFFPNTNEVAGWSRGEVRTFDANGLWQYIDGDAERYVKAGTKGASTADYKFQSGAVKLDAVADVYTMNSPAAAKKIYTGENASGSQKLLLGDAAKGSATSITFIKGPYIVRLVAYKKSPQTQPALLALAKGILKHLGH